MSASTTLPFLEKLLQILAQGGFTSTYKYAVLLGLVDLCVESRLPPTMLTTFQLARRVVELYWPQVRPFARPGGVAGLQSRLLQNSGGQARLLQNSGGQAQIATLVATFQEAHPDLMSCPRLTPGRPGLFERLVREVEWVLIEYPLPRLQRVGGGEECFLYDIDWDEKVSRADVSRYQRGEPSDFSNAIRLQPGAAESMVALAAVVRPLVQQQWLAKVRAMNALEESELERFMFGVERVRLAALHRPLRLLQAGRCFYCLQALAGEKGEVDHFLPWSRYAEDGLDNLVLAHGACNRKKLHFLADLDYGHRWCERSVEQADRLGDIADDLHWPKDVARTFGVVASVYRGVPDGVRLWAGGDDLRRIGEADLPVVHHFADGLAGRLRVEA